MMRRSDLQITMVLWHAMLTVAIITVGTTAYPYGVPHPLLLVGMAFAGWAVLSMWVGYAVTSKPPKDDY